MKKGEQMRFGAAIEHGSAHEQDHQQWSRRNFLRYSGMAAIGSTAILSGQPFAAPGLGGLGSALRDLESDRILVLIQLKGGWDGMSTIIPVTEQVYHDARPAIRVTPSEAIMLDAQYGLNPGLSSLYPLWGNGEMAVVHNVGYPDSSLSHFRATDIYNTSAPIEYLKEGWVGRTMESQYPDFLTSPTTFPLSVEFGSAASRLIQGTDTAMGVVIRDPDEFYRIAATGETYDPFDVPATPCGEKLAFLRDAANQANQYAGSIYTAANASSNYVSYPSSALAEDLSIVARLIHGGLGSHVYVVQLTGFDTHADQNNRLANLYGQLGPAVAAFLNDVKAGGAGDKVLVSTYSEFGRRLSENFSEGTDHGTASPMLLFGTDASLVGGFHGPGPDLVNLDTRGNPKFSTDFRDVYGTLLNSWFGLDCAVSSDVLGYEFTGMDFIQNPTGVGSPCAVTSVSLRVNLSSIYDASIGEMMTSSNHAVPTTQPFSASPWDYAGDEVCSSVVAQNPDVVDWVLVGLRTSKTSPDVARRALLLKKDGTLVDTDGVSAPRLYGVAAGSYHLVVRHRNSLSVVSGTTITL